MMAVLEKYDLKIGSYQEFLNNITLMWEINRKKNDLNDFEILSTGPSDESGHFFYYEDVDCQREVLRSIWKQISEFLIKIISDFKENYTQSIDDVLESLFNFTITFFLNHSSKSSLSFLGSFQTFFNLFKLVGLDKIPIDTINKIIVFLQKQQTESDWVNLDYIKHHYESLPITTSTEYKEKIKDLISALRSRKKQEQQRQQLLDELQALIEDEEDE